MLLDSLQKQNDILGYAMQVSALRNEVIQNNIANVDVPNFKRKVVLFDEEFAKALDSEKIDGVSRFRNVKPIIKQSQDDFSYRLDGNNVDIEKEMIDSYMNAVRYDTIASSLMRNYKNINMVLTSK